MAQHPYVLGISAFFHDSAAALVRDDEIIAAAQEERFSRQKGDWQFPHAAIKYCRSFLPKNEALAAVSFYENPLLKIDRIISNAKSNYPRGAPIWTATLRRLRMIDHELPALLRSIEPDDDKIHFVAHHRSHAASAFYPSPFERAAILVVDGVGEWATTSIWSGDGDSIEPIREIAFPHSLGLLYSAFTQYCGFKVNSGEYKLMGLAPYGRPVFCDLIRENLIDVKEDGSFTLNMRYFGFATEQMSITPLFSELFGQQPRAPSGHFSAHYMNVAASIQQVTNEVMAGLAAAAQKLTGAENLCMAGGVALNCVANSYIAKHVPAISRIWVQPTAGDAGGALGCALTAANRLAESRRRPTSVKATTVSGAAVCPGLVSKTSDRMKGAFLGPEFTAAEIGSALVKHGLMHELIADEDALVSQIAKALAGGLVVGHFHGRMEFGPRALGNRSILADARPASMFSRVNRQIKNREGWRPFAPIVLAEKVSEIFDPPIDSPYMLFVTAIRDTLRCGPSLAGLRAEGRDSPVELADAQRSPFPAVTHCDYSARLQTVDVEQNPRLYRILSRFFDLSECPLLLNTSFNVRGEPIVCSPDDAIRAFLNSGLDWLVLDRYVVKRQDMNEAQRSLAGSVTFHDD
jgi:carbamoyltransferase